MSAALALVEIAAADPFGLVRAMNRMSAAGFALSVRDNRLLASPFTKLSEQQRAYLRTHKAALVELLEDAETLHRALVVAGPAGLGWQAGTPADWDDVRLLGAGETLYGARRMVSAHGRRFAAESAPPGPDIPPDMPSAPLAESPSTAATCADKRPDIARADPPPTKPLSPLDGDIVAYLARVATTASEEEIHRQVNRGQQGRTLALVRVALHKLVQAGLVDKINNQFRLARVAA